MSLIIALGSNIEPKIQNLKFAQLELNKYFKLIKASNIYESVAVDYENQDSFLNMVIEFEIPKDKTAQEILEILMHIEKIGGRTREIDKGPRTIDLDLIFLGLNNINTPDLIVPHPRCFERSFVIIPLQELPFFQTIKKCFTIPTSFNVESRLIK
jgi:2-amino-4-hydroxy-6-hydroxymethyldihydropteridine diphosphokinase